MSTEINLPAVKDAIKTVLAANNTSTGAPILDLSDRLSPLRVQQILEYNPIEIQPQPSFFPCVCIHTEGKTIELSDMAVNQINGRRKGVATFFITGVVWVDTFDNPLEDPSVTQVEYLMENIEQVLRGYPDLNANCKWQYPTAIDYGSLISEDVHLRAGRLTLEATFYY